MHTFLWITFLVDFLSDHGPKFCDVSWLPLKVISKVGDLVGIKYFPAEPPKHEQDRKKPE